MNTELQDYLNGICCSTPVTYNFDVDSSDWAGSGITDQASFESVLGVTTDAFVLSGNNIKANILTTTNNTLDFNGQTVTDVNYITVIGLQRLDFRTNQIVAFNPSVALPITLNFLALSQNQMTLNGYTESEPWANGMHTAPSGGFINFNNNTDSVSGTNLESILIAKGWI
jgi:hypothetical protein